MVPKFQYGTLRVLGTKTQMVPKTIIITKTLQKNEVYVGNKALGLFEILRTKVVNSEFRNA